jgi:hypothetical protein
MNHLFNESELLAETMYPDEDLCSVPAMVDVKPLKSLKFIAQIGVYI